MKKLLLTIALPLLLIATTAHFAMAGRRGIATAVMNNYCNTVTYVDPCIQYWGGYINGYGSAGREDNCIHSCIIDKTLVATGKVADCTAFCRNMEKEK